MFSPTSFDIPLVLHQGPVLTRMNDEQFFEFCRANRDLRIERTAQGDLIIMPPTGGNTGKRNISLSKQLAIWSDEDRTGIAFDSSTLFKLPNGSFRSPDASWVRLERWNALTEEQRERFPPLAPDFVAELRSKSDRLEELREKMREYIENGVRLGLLIDPYAHRVEVHRPGQEPVILDNPTTVSAEPELPGFVLQLESIW